MSSILHSILDLKVPVHAFNQKKALVGAFSVIVKTDGGSLAALLVTTVSTPTTHKCFEEYRSKVEVDLKGEKFPYLEVYVVSYKR